MSSEKRNYETTYIINASLEDSQIEAAVTHVAEVIERNGGAITATNRWGRKRLAYPIEKKNNGFYINIEFNGPGQLIGQLERAYLLDENILRFLTIQLDKHAIAAKAKSAAEIAVPEVVEAPKPAVQAQQAQKEPETRAPLFTEEN